MKKEVLLGDCLELMKDIPDGSIDMILCDLPYGTTQNKWDSVLPLDLLWQQYERIIKPNGAIVLTAAQPFTSALVMSNPKMFKYQWVWVKNRATGHLNAKKQPLRNTEDVLVFYKKQPIYNPQLTEGIPYKKTPSKKTYQGYGLHKPIFQSNSGFRLPQTTLHIDSEQNEMHPTQKPVALFEYLIKTYTNEGDLVLDNCAGSGTTGVACLNTNRNYILMEKEQKYFEIIKKRIEEAEHNLFNV